QRAQHPFERHFLAGDVTVHSSQSSSSSSLSSPSSSSSSSRSSSSSSSSPSSSSSSGARSSSIGERPVTSRLEPHSGQLSWSPLSTSNSSTSMSASHSGQVAICLLGASNPHGGLAMESVRCQRPAAGANAIGVRIIAISCANLQRTLTSPLIGSDTF